MRALVLCSALLASSLFGFSQVTFEGTPAFYSFLHQTPPTPFDGNGTLGNIYNNTACGLDYVSGFVKTGLRNPVGGTAQPAAIVISGIPGSATVIKAYLWTGGPSNGLNVTATLTNPLSQTNNFTMTQIGQGPDACWAYAGTYHHRADVTSAISGNGTYFVSGLPTNPPTVGVDMNGATLLIIYSDPSQLFQGTLIINDGCIVAMGGTSTQTLTGFNLCMNSLSGKVFSIVSDLQMNGSQLLMNNTNAPFTWNWWNFIETTTNFTQNQTNSAFSVLAGGDCYSWVNAGLYFRTNCIACCQPTFSLASATTPNSCNSNGTATATIIGGTPPYAYQWNTIPAQTNATATGLGAGIYNCYVTDANGCASIIDTVINSGVNVTISNVFPSCTGQGTATANVTGGTSPYTYAWNTVPVQTNANATGLNPGTYTVTVTDNGGCMATASITLTTATPSGTTTVQNTACGPNGQATVVASGGSPPYTYSWTTVPVQTNANATGLTAGSYTVTITDSNGCTGTVAATITNSPQVLTITASPNPIGCMGSSQLNVSSNYPSPTYNWSPASSLSCTTCPNPVATPSVSTSYLVTSTTACGTANGSIIINVGGGNFFVENICEVTVDTAINKHMVIWERTAPMQVTFYRVFKETTTPNQYTIIGSQPKLAFTTFTDLNSNPFLAADRYKLATQDTCGFQSIFSVHHRTIHLTVTNGVNNSWNLIWNAYEGFAVPGYDVYRGTNNNNMTLIASLSSTTFNYNDATPPLGAIQYLIVASNPSPCNPSLRLADPFEIQAYNSTNSNVVQVITQGWGEENINPGFVIFQGPESGSFTIIVPQELRDVELEITNMLGQKISTQLVQNGVSFIHVGAANGMYVMRFKGTFGKFSHKVIKE